MRNDPSHYKRRFLAATVAGTAVLLALDLFFPLNWDNEIFQSMATDLLRFGRLPYLGSWAHDFPGTVYMHWLSIVLFGNSAIGFRLFDFVLHLGIAWLFFNILSRWLLPRTAFISVLFYMLHYIGNGILMAGQRDEFAIFFLLVGTLLLIVAKEHHGALSYVNALGAGIALTLMFTFRATYGTFAVVGLIFCFLLKEERVLKISFYCTGVALVLIALFLPYFMQPGGIEQVYWITVRYNLDIYGPIRLSLGKALHEFRVQKFFLLLSTAGFLLALLPRLRPLHSRNSLWQNVRLLDLADVVLYSGFGVAGLLSLFVMGKFIPYHFEPVILVGSPFSALALESFLDAIHGRTWKVVAVVSLSLYIVLRIYPFNLLATFGQACFGTTSLDEVRNAFIHEPGYRRSVDAAVASYIDRTAPPHTGIECATLKAGIRWRLQHRAIGRFTTFYPLSMSEPDGSHPSYQMAWRREFIASILTEKPYYIVMANGPQDIIDWVHYAPAMSIHQIEGFDSIVEPHYQYDTTIGGYTLWKLKG